MPSIDRLSVRLGLAMLLAWGLGAVLAPMGQATEPFPTHAPLSRSVPGAQNLGTGLAPGQQIGANQYVLSGNGQYELDMFADGLGVLWNMPAGGLACPMWTSPAVVNYVMSDYPWSLVSSPVPGAFLIMQDDGNFVLYPAPGGSAQWASGTDGHAGATLALQDDGNLVVYQGSTALWATSTNNYRGPVLCKGNTLQPNQRLVQSEFMNNPWGVTDGSKATSADLLVNTNGDLEILEPYATITTKLAKNAATGSYLIMQDDGNLVYYEPNGTVKWASDTSGHPGAVALMANWGHLLIVDPQTNVIIGDFPYSSHYNAIGETVGQAFSPVNAYQ